MVSIFPKKLTLDLKSNHDALLASDSFQANSNLVGRFTVIRVADWTALVEDFFCALHFFRAAVSHHLCQSHCALLLELPAFYLFINFRGEEMVFR